MNTNANTVVAANVAAEVELNVGDLTTCQFGNPGDTHWDEFTHCHVQVKVVLKEKCEITNRMYYLVSKVDDSEYLGRAGMARKPRHEDGTPIAGVLYCTNARLIGSKAQKWTGIHTFAQAARSMGFELPQ